MFYCASIKQVTKAAVLFTLLMFSTLSQAESYDNAGVSDSAAKTEPGLKVAAEDQPRDFKFPAWPERQQSNRQVVPPPPPGPYMSSALSDFSVKGPSFGRDSDKLKSNNAASGLDSSNIPMQTFSPDRPWPEHAYKKHQHSRDSSPQRWMPENGYQYVKPVVKNRPYPVAPNRMPGQLNMPAMRWPGSQLPTSRLPPAGNTANGVYPTTPNYGSRYNDPMN